MFSPVSIPTKDFKRTDVPEKIENWQDFIRFAATFDKNEDSWYKLACESQDLTKLTTQTELGLLRAHLFLEYRRWNHFGRPIDAESFSLILKVADLIREKLA